MTRRAMEYISATGDMPWCLHLSFIKPHWPYIAPAPYNDMYGPEHMIPVVRSQQEKNDPHPVYREFMNHRVSTAFARDEVRENVVPVYMGLIKQIDDQMGVLFSFLEERGLIDDTVIVLTSDHGDYLGDHWMGEKDLFHDPSVRIPLIIVDPSPDADPTRGSVCDELVESIDLAPTFVDWMGGNSASQSHRLEGRSLLPLIRGGPLPAWRDHVFSEYDYSTSQTAVRLGVKPRDARLFMVADKRWKYVHAIGFRPMLFDLESDPNELVDLGADSGHEDVRQRLAAVLAEWGLRMSHRTTLSEAEVESRRGKSQRRGILVGVWEEGELPADLWSGYYGERK
jgi:arylsulfatase A-like enzyme